MSDKDNQKPSFFPDNCELGFGIFGLIAGMFVGLGVGSLSGNWVVTAASTVLGTALVGAAGIWFGRKLDRAGPQAQ